MVDRPAVIRAIAEARDHGDLSENAEYHAARERQSFIEGRLGELEDKIARAEIIDVSKLSGSVIKFGATVTLADEETDEEQTFQIVGEDEADIKRPPLGHFAPGARPDRQGQRRQRRGLDPARQQILRDRHRRFRLSLKTAFSSFGRRPEGGRPRLMAAATHPASDAALSEGARSHRGAPHPPLTRFPPISHCLVC